MQETEITVQVFNKLEEIKTILDKQGFAHIKTKTLNDYYFSRFDNQTIKELHYPQLLANSFLIREIGLPDKKIVELLYKNKSIDENGVVISEEKIKSNLDDFENAVKVLKKAGLNCWCNLKQDLFIYAKEKIEFALQVVEGVGIFIEYEEDESMTGLSEQEKINIMLANLKEIGLKLGDDYSCKKVFMKLKGK